MNVLSLFDGISCGYVALERAGIQVDKYYSSEIDDDAFYVSLDNYPQITRLGDVNKISGHNMNIDLLIGGSPCQSFSLAGNQGAFNDPRGQLFFQYFRLLNETKPKYFLLENVVMNKDNEQVITNHLGVEPILIDSASVSAQTRRRLYWTNIPNVSQPEDKKLTIKDIMEVSDNYEWVHENYRASAKFMKNYVQYDLTGKGHNSQNFRAYYTHSKMGCLNYSTPHGAKILTDDGRIRKTTRLEHERLQTLPDNYTRILPINKAKQAIGNGWTVDVIAHIFRGIQ